MKEIIKKIVPLVILILAINAVVYAFTAFVTWQSNPAQWDSFTRFMLAIISGMLSIAAIGLYFECINDN